MIALSETILGKLSYSWPKRHILPDFV